MKIEYLVREFRANMKEALDKAKTHPVYIKRDGLIYEVKVTPYKRIPVKMMEVIDTNGFYEPTRVQVEPDSRA